MKTKERIRRVRVYAVRICEACGDTGWVEYRFIEAGKAYYAKTPCPDCDARRKAGRP